jgi:hypothetical protein
MRWLGILGRVLIALGILWILQGLNVLLGSVMSGRPVYAVLGLAVAVLGAVLVLTARARAMRGPRRST